MFTNPQLEPADDRRGDLRRQCSGLCRQEGAASFDLSVGSAFGGFLANRYDLYYESEVPAVGESSDPECLST